jgi:hypothetical protein
MSRPHLNKDPEELKALARERSKIWYQANKLSVKSKSADNFIKTAEERKRQKIYERYPNGVKQSRETGKVILLDEITKYRRCQSCCRHYDQVHTLFINPTCEIWETIKCIGCNDERDKILVPSL